MLQQLRLHLRRERSKILSFSFGRCLKTVFFSVITDHNKDLEVIEMKVDIMNTEKKYQVIYADPPWSYRQQGSKETGK